MNIENLIGFTRTVQVKSPRHPIRHIHALASLASLAVHSGTIHAR
jgi:hypothetical protein